MTCTTYSSNREREKMGIFLQNNHSHGQRGNKSCALMLMFAFVVAIMGVMVVHKLREKRIFTLLVEEKNQELLTLHHLFQREKEFNQEARKKMEEMTNKVYALRTQKLDLDQKLSEMESTISSLKDERKVIELNFKENKKDIKMLTARDNLRTRDSHEVSALKNLIKMKDAEIETLKLQLNKPENGQSGKHSNIDYRIQLSSDSSSHTRQSEEKNQHDITFQRANEHIPNIKPEQPHELKYKAKETHVSNEEGRQKFRYNQAIDGEDDYQENVSGMSRKKYTKGKTGETFQKRISRDESLYTTSKAESTPAITNNGEQKNYAKYKNEKVDVINRKEDQLALSDSINQTVHTLDDDQSVEEAENQAKDREKLSRKNESNEISKKLHEQEKKDSREVKNEYNNEKHDEVVIEEGETEDSDEAETHEPEIDRDDIRRFSESDPDEEGEETEF